jgi:hypothetical protein
VYGKSTVLLRCGQLLYRSHLPNDKVHHQSNSDEEWMRRVFEKSDD